MYKKQRSHLKHALSAAVVRSDYASLLETKARQYLERCDARPENILPETTRVIGEAIIQLTYGKLGDGQGKDYIQITTRLLEIMILSLQGYAVDIFPACMKFKRDAALWRKEIRDLEETVFELVKENACSDDPVVQSSFIFKRIQTLRDKDEEGQDVQQLREDEMLLSFSGLQIFLGKFAILAFRGTMYDWALETTEATMQSFIRAMTVFPSVQKAAQAEIDRVIGSSRLPTFQDQLDLPYLHAVVLETLRWNPMYLMLQEKTISTMVISSRKERVS
ncbi:hypothetical protein FRC00_011993 [Tulasnella sp. 408]|nr:hypothetical protein FRC00_011993 [Tulasnella sp. 408]